MNQCGWFRKMYQLILCVFVGFITLTGCDEETSENQFPKYEEFGDRDQLVPQLVLKSMRLGGPYIGVEEYNITCHMDGDELNLFVDGLNTPRPFIPIREPDMPCQPLEDDGVSYIIHCDQHVISEFVYWWDRFDIIVDKYDWAEKDVIGEFNWTVDGMPYFWCTWTFEITGADLEYVEKQN